MTRAVEERLGEALEHHAKGQFRQAEEACREILRQAPGHPEALHRLGLLARDEGRKDRALEFLVRAATIRPEYAPFQGDLGTTLLGYRQFQSAIRLLEEALRLDPERSADRAALAHALVEAGESERAIEIARELFAKDVGAENVLASLTGALTRQRRIPEALEVWRSFLDETPHAGLHSAFLFVLHYAPEVSPEDLLAEHRRFADRHEAALLARHARHPNGVEPERRLRIGYVSPDLKLHPVQQFLMPLLERHDARNFEVFCYSNVTDPDSATAEIAKLQGNRWRDVVLMNDETLAAQVRTDRIDILIDLAGHTGGNRLLMFGRKPAPVQVTWLGYPDTSGLRSMDYRITDAWADPPGKSDELHTEKLWRVPCFLTFVLPPYAPAVQPPPCAASGRITFGSFNNFMKISAPVVEAWARILTEVEGSRLILKHRDSRDPGTRENLLRAFEELGAGRDRVEFAMQMPGHAQHLDSYRDIDIALDPFPYNGTTTTCEALGMGVPLVALEGQAHVGRVSAMLLRQYGLADWVAGSMDDYVRIAVERAAEPGKLAGLRRSMRGRLKASELGSPDGFARDMEGAYRGMWRAWCGGAAG